MRRVGGLEASMRAWALVLVLGLSCAAAAAEAAMIKETVSCQVKDTGSGAVSQPAFGTVQLDPSGTFSGKLKTPDVFPGGGTLSGFLVCSVFCSGVEFQPVSCGHLGDLGPKKSFSVKVKHYADVISVPCASPSLRVAGGDGPLAIDCLGSYTH
jgi:hypothetical protein